MSQLLDSCARWSARPTWSRGEAIHADYTHDETLKAEPVVPIALVLPGSTGEVSEVLKLASEHGVPVIARGSGTGLSGAAIPVADGILLAFDRMKRIREIDTENQVAVVEPGVTLEQLNGELATLGLIYPVSPGEQSGSLGGNVATNAGGMRAVRYGVTRHHVLGLEVVLADGTVLRTGGKFVKCSSGYDLTQLLIGSEGTLAITTEVTVKLAAAARPSRRRSSRRSRTWREVAQAVPHIVQQRHQPLHPRVRRHHGDGRHHRRRRGLDLGIPQDGQGRARSPTSSSCSKAMDAGRVDEDVERLGILLEELGALDVYVLPADAGRPAHRGPGAGLLRGQGGRLRRPHRRRGARGPPSPSYLAQVAMLAQEHGALDDRVRPHRRRQRPPHGLPARRRAPRTRCMHGELRAGAGVGRCHLGRARHRHGEAALLPRARGPGVARSSCGRSSGPSIPTASSAPDRLLGMSPGERRGAIGMNGARSLLSTSRRRRGRRLLRQPRHVGDALRRRARRRAGDARRALPVRGCGHRRGRRLRAHAPDGRRRRCSTWARASATAWPTCTTPGGPAPRSSTSSATTPPITPATTRRCSRTSRPSPAPSRAGTAQSPGADDVAADARRRRRRPRTGRRAASPRWSCPADVSWSESRDGPVPAAARAPSEPLVAGRHGRRGGQGAALRRARGAAPRRRRAARRRAACRQPGRRHDGRRAARRDLPRQPRAWRGHPRRGAPGLLRRDGAGPARRRPPPDPGRAPRRRSPSSPTRARPATWSRRAAPCTPWRGPGEDAARRTRGARRGRRCGSRRSRARARRRGPSGPPGP